MDGIFSTGLGPILVLWIGALVLYILDRFREPQDRGVAEVVVLCLALGFALSGHFDSALEGWRQAHQDNPQGVEGSERVLTLTGAGALGLSDADFETDSVTPVRAAMRLVWRTLIVWLVVLSLLVLAGWAG